MKQTKTDGRTVARLRGTASAWSSSASRFILSFGLAFLTPAATADVVGYFKFDTFPGDNANFADDTGKGLQGLLGYPFSAPVSVAGPSAQANDRAVSFDGKGALAVDDSAAEVLNILAAPITLECWVRTSNFPARHLGLISYGVPGGQPEDRGPGGYKLGIAPSGEILFTLYAIVDVASGIPYPFDDAWHHVAASYSIPDGGVRFFLDGQEVAFVPETTSDFSPPGTRHLNIGAQFTGLRGFEGAIDRVRISKAALTLAELDSVVGAVKPTRADTAVFFNFDEANPPYQGQGLAPAGVAISMADWAVNHPPFTTDGAPPKVSDTPSGAADDLALSFGGADMAAVADPNGVLNLSDDWTLEAWIKIGPAVDRGIIFYYGHPAHGYSMSVDFSAGNKLQVTTLGILDMPSDTAVVEVDVWQHVAVVHKKGQSMTYFINGVEKGTLAYTGGTNLATTTKTLFIGAEWDGGLPFAGLIDRIRISNSALTATQLDSDPLNPAVVPPATSTLRLDIARSQSSVIISWPETGSAGFALEFSTTLVNWSPDPAVPVVVAGRKTVTISLPAADRNFRLKRP